MSTQKPTANQVSERDHVIANKTTEDETSENELQLEEDQDAATVLQLIFTNEKEKRDGSDFDEECEFDEEEEEDEDDMLPNFPRSKAAGATCLIEFSKKHKSALRGSDLDKKMDEEYLKNNHY